VKVGELGERALDEKQLAELSTARQCSVLDGRLIRRSCPGGSFGTTYLVVTTDMLHKKNALFRANERYQNRVDGHRCNLERYRWMAQTPLRDEALGIPREADVNLRLTSCVGCTHAATQNGTTLIGGDQMSTTNLRSWALP